MSSPFCKPERPPDASHSPSRALQSRTRLFSSDSRSRKQNKQFPQFTLFSFTFFHHMLQYLMWSTTFRGCATKQKPKNSLTTKHWFGYMFGDWGGCMTFTLMASIFGLYCTNVLGVDPVLMGTLTIIGTVWDAINDPMMGALMDKAFE